MPLGGGVTRHENFFRRRSQRLYTWCEQQHVTYTIGLIPNRRLTIVAAALLMQAMAQSTAQGGAKVRLAGETTYQARTWPTPRRVVYKAEALAKGPNTRFVVTSRTDEPLAVYDWYVDRGRLRTTSPAVIPASRSGRLCCRTAHPRE